MWPDRVSNPGSLTLWSAVRPVKVKYIFHLLHTELLPLFSFIMHAAVKLGNGRS